jgi:hypothetical protein
MISLGPRKVLNIVADNLVFHISGRAVKKGLFPLRIDDFPQLAAGSFNSRPLSARRCRNTEPYSER